MHSFLKKHSTRITGSISCFDRIQLRGYLPFRWGQAVERFLDSQGVLYKDFKPFARQLTEDIIAHAHATAERTGRPLRHLNGHFRKEDEAAAIARRDQITDGLVCIFTAVEPISTFCVRPGKNRPHIQRDYRKGLCIYYYLIHAQLGPMYIRIQSWFPFIIQIGFNGHEWLARKLDQAGIAYQRIDNAFSSIGNPDRAQQFADHFAQKHWMFLLSALAKTVNPLLSGLFYGMGYYWVIDQAEYATDIFFKDRASLKDLYQQLLRHASLSFSAEDVLSFLGRKLSASFQGEILNDLKKRWSGARIKHRMKENWIKMYDKAGLVLRIETVINDPGEFKVYRTTTHRDGTQSTGWYPMPKGIANLYLYARVASMANKRYIHALAAVDDPAQSRKLLATLTRPAPYRGRNKRAINPAHPDDLKLFLAVMRGEHHIHGFRNRDILRHLHQRIPSDPNELKRLTRRVTSLLQLLYAHGLIKRAPKSRRYYITALGAQLMPLAIRLYHHDAPRLLTENAA